MAAASLILNKCDNSTTVTKAIQGMTTSWTLYWTSADNDKRSTPGRREGRQHINVGVCRGQSKGRNYLFFQKH
jgi:hypothetical protein